MPDSHTPEQIRISHLIDDHETVRGHALRTIRDQRALLLDALDAIRAGRTAVADEFVDRAVEALGKEVEWLRGRRPTAAFRAR